MKLFEMSIEQLQKKLAQVQKVLARKRRALESVKDTGSRSC